MISVTEISELTVVNPYNVYMKTIHNKNGSPYKYYKTVRVT